MLHLFSINLLNCFCSIVKLFILCLHVFVNVSEKKVYSNLSHIELRSPIKHRQFFKKVSRNRDYFQTHCNDRRNPFHFACRQWY